MVQLEVALALQHLDMVRAKDQSGGMQEGGARAIFCLVSVSTLAQYQHREGSSTTEDAKLTSQTP